MALALWLLWVCQPLLAQALRKTGARGPPPPQQASLGAPTDMLVDLAEPQAAPLLLVVGRSARPTFSFLAPVAAAGPSTNRSVLVTDYQIVVRDSVGATAWDSGKAPARGSAAGTSAVVCGNALESGLSYTWSATYWAGAQRSEPATSAFTVGLLSESDWAGAEWIGSGQRQFQLTPPQSVRAKLRRFPGAKVKLHVAAPGGAVVEAGGATQGDPVGLSLWTANDKTVQYFSFDLTSTILDADGEGTAEIVVTIGGGFFASTVRPAKASNGARPAMCRLLLLLDTGAGGKKERILLRSSATPSSGIEGRSGPVLADDPWMGSTMNTSLSATEGWGATKLADEEDVPHGQLVPLPMPYATKRGSLSAVSAGRALENRPGSLLYTFAANIVGHASVAAAAVTGNGWIRLEHCEVWNHSAGGCVPFGTPPYEYPLPICGRSSNGSFDDGSSRAGCDTYLVGDGSSGTRLLAPKFTWHGFQHVVVTPGPGVTFSGEVDAVSAHWTTSDLSRTASIRFGGEGAELLSSLDQIVLNSQLSNLAAYMPTDCPTREKVRLKKLFFQKTWHF